MTTTASIMTGENYRKGDSDTASKNVGSFVNINSISIELEDVNDKSCVEKCDHFSIRGYVSEVRRKNWKLCWPFALDDEQNKSEEQKVQLPPLTSPKFRWWSCQSCLQEIGCGGTAKDHDHDTRSNNFSIGSKSKSDCSQLPSLRTAAMHLPDVQQAPKTNIVEKRKSDVHTSTDVNTKSMHQDKKEVGVAEAHTTFIGPEKGAENDNGRELPGITFGPADINLNVMQEKPEYEIVTEAVELDGSRPVSKGRDGNDVELASPKGMCKNSIKICITENQNSVDEQLRELNIASGSSVLACLNDGAGDAVRQQTNEYVSRVSDECDHASSESVEIVGNNLHSTTSGLQRRKTRKVRLLTELLCDNGDAKTDQVSTEVSPSNAANSASAGVGMVYVPQGQVSFPENYREDLADSKKRKLPQDEEWRSPETSSRVNLNKKVKNCKGSEEIANSMADSKLEGDASAGLHLQTGTKSHWSKYEIDSIPITEKKKTKNNQIIDARSFLVPVGENFPNQVLDEVGFSSKGKIEDCISFRVVTDASSSRSWDKVPLAASRKEKKPTLFKNKSKMPQVDDGQASQCPWNSGLLQEGPTMRSEEIMQTGPIPVSFRQADAATIDTGLQLSLSSYAAPKKCNRKYSPQVGEGMSPLSWQEGGRVDETVRKNVELNYISDAAIPGKSSSYAFFKKRVHSELNGKLATYNMPALNEKQKNSQIEEGFCSLGKQMDISGASNCHKTIKVKEHSGVTRKRGDKIVDKVPDQGTFDDYPMEIVELMAQYQYERRLENAENNKILLNAANEGRNSQMLDYGKVYGTEKFRISEEPNTRTNSQARNGRNGISTARKNVQPSKQKSVDYIPNVNGDHVNNSHLGQKKSSGSVQLPASSSSTCSCAQNCKWHANMVGHGFFNAGMQRGACDACPIISRPVEEAAQIWPSVPLQRPARYNVPQNGAPQRSNLHMVPSTPGLPQKGDNVNREHELKYLKLGAPNLEIPSQHISSETFSRRNAEYPFANKHNGIEHQQNLRGSLDLYSNETIPAMHLLSLMDAGMPSGTTFSTGGNTKFLKRDCPPDNNSKEYSQMPIGVYSKPRDTMKHPLDYHGKNQLPMKSHDFFPVNPMAGPSTSSFHHDKGFETPNDFMGQVSFSSRGKEKVQKGSGAPAQNRGRKPLNSAFSSGGFVPNHNAIPIHSMQKGFLGSSSSMVFPLQPRTAENSTELKLETPHYTGTFRPPKSRHESSICCVNRNPADFSIPEAGNEYMIQGEDLKVGKPRKRPGLTTADQRKRQRNAKRTTEKERA